MTLKSVQIAMISRFLDKIDSCYSNKIYVPLRWQPSLMQGMVPARLSEIKLKVL